MKYSSRKKKKKKQTKQKKNELSVRKSDRCVHPSSCVQGLVRCFVQGHPFSPGFHSVFLRFLSMSGLEFYLPIFALGTLFTRGLVCILEVKNILFFLTRKKTKKNTQCFIERRNTLPKPNPTGPNLQEREKKNSPEIREKEKFKKKNIPPSTF